MVTFSHTIAAHEGLHARPVALICRCAMDHTATVEIACGAAHASARDMIGLMALEACQGDVLQVTVEGPDEQACAEALQQVFADVL